MGELHLRLSPQAFVELHNLVCAQQGCIDDHGDLPLDLGRYPFNTLNVATRRAAAGATPTVAPKCRTGTSR